MRPKTPDNISCFNKLWNVLCGDCFRIWEDVGTETEMDDLEYGKPKASENSIPPPHFFRSPAYYASCRREQQKRREKVEKEEKAKKEESSGNLATEHEEPCSTVSAPVESIVTHRIPHNLRVGHVSDEPGTVPTELEKEEDSFVLL